MGTSYTEWHHCRRVNEKTGSFLTSLQAWNDIFNPQLSPDWADTGDHDTACSIWSQNPIPPTAFFSGIQRHWCPEEPCLRGTAHLSLEGGKWQARVQRCPSKQKNFPGCPMKGSQDIWQSFLHPPLKAVNLKSNPFMVPTSSLKPRLLLNHPTCIPDDNVQS